MLKHKNQIQSDVNLFLNTFNVNIIIYKIILFKNVFKFFSLKQCMTQFEPVQNSLSVRKVTTQEMALSDSHHF